MAEVEETSSKLQQQIRAELERNFKSIDEEVLNYLIGVIDLNKDDFSSIDDIQEATGAILGELSEGENDDEFIYELCSKFMDILQYNNPTLGLNRDDENDDGIKILSNPVTIGEWVVIDKARADQEVIKESMFDVTKETISYVDPKKLQKIDAKLKKKLDRKEGIYNTDKAAFDPAKFNSVSTATASQAMNKKTEALKDNENNRTMDVVIENFDVAFGNKQLLSQADMTLSYGRRYCLIGRNGIGKTTLLKMISSGALKIPAHIKILHVEQEVHGDDTLAIDSVLSCDVRRNDLLEMEKELTKQINDSTADTVMKLQEKLSKVYIDLEACDADKALPRAAKILCGLGFSPEDQKRPTSDFSGGWRMRLALARALFAKPDLLLLDEPTNMLDLKAIIWLENYLQTWQSTLLIVSHDRSFLNEVSQEILYLHSQKIEPFRGNYENFLKTKGENQKNQQREYEAQLEYRQHIQLFIDKFRYNANRAATVQSKIKQLEKLPELKPVEKEKEVHLRFPEVDHLNGTILRLDEVSYYYSKERYIFKKVDISASMDSRIVIVGENGSGKTTLLKILTGINEPVEGFRHTHRALRIGYFTQHHVDGLTMNMNCIEVMQSKFPNRPIEEYRGELGRFGVSGDMASQSIASLSGGQKSRVAFALLSMLQPNFLILDEPTNHLDMETIEALGGAINKFTGGVILVSHDERLITLVCKELWLARDGQVKSIKGGYEEYRKLIEKELEF